MLLVGLTFAVSYRQDQMHVGALLQRVPLRSPMINRDATTAKLKVSMKEYQGQTTEHGGISD